MALSFLDAVAESGYKPARMESVLLSPHEGIYSVTPAMAAHWLATLNYEHQRKIRAYHVSALAREMEAGRFRQKTQVNFCELGGAFHLTNGQHTLAAIAKSGIAQTLCVIVTCVDSERDIADDFSRHDTHLTRRVADSLTAHQVHAELGITPTQLQIVTAGCVFYAAGIGEIPLKNSAQLTHDERIAIVRRHGPRAVDALRLVDGQMDKSWLVRKTTFGAIMHTLPHGRAAEFWEGVRDDDGLRLGDPRKTLREFLRDSRTMGSGQGVKTNKVVPTYMLVKGIASGWNAWVQRRNLQIIRVNSSAASVADFDQVGPFKVY